MSLRHVFVIASLLCAASLASADVVPIPEFTGYSTEGFEDGLTPGGHPSPVEIFGGRCSMDDSFSHTVVITNSRPGSGGTVTPFVGDWMGGTTTGDTIFEFADPVTDFGTYITTNAAVGDGTITFSDASGALIGTLPLTVEPVTWGWQGWHSDTPISRIVMTPNSGLGWGLIFDAMQVNWVPEPASLGLLAMAALMLVRRR